MTDDLTFALELAAAAESEIVPRFRQTEVLSKADGTPVTEADLQAERAMRRLIAEHRPKDGILGEEHGLENAESRRTWVIDPIDGTASFAMGLPTFGTLVGLLEDGKPILGVIHLPALQETVYASVGGGCWHRERGQEPIQTSVPTGRSVAQARIATTGVYRTDIDPRTEHHPIQLSRLIQACPGFRFVGDCVQYALLATGRLDAALDSEMNPWDIAALVPCIREAGGRVTSLRGKDTDLVNAPHLLASSCQELHHQILRLTDTDSHSVKS